MSHYGYQLLSFVYLCSNATLMPTPMLISTDVTQIVINQAKKKKANETSKQFTNNHYEGTVHF